MKGKTAKAVINKSEFLERISQAPNSSGLLGIVSNPQGSSKQGSKQQIREISAGKLENEDSILRESAKSLELKTEFSGKSSQTSTSSGSQPKATQLQRFTKNPQISRVPGVSPRERHRYCVVIGSEILGDRLTLDEAIALANQSTHQ